MKLKKEEKDFLGLKKHRQGKSCDEIKEDFYTLNNLDKTNKSKDKLIIKLQNELEKKEKELNKAKKEIFNLKLISSSSGKVKKDVVGELNKFLSLVTGTELPEQEIRNLCQLDKERFKQIAGFLKRNKLISERISKGYKFYIKNE